MLYDNLEKLFLIPFFKLFEIFYISHNKENNFIKLKEENFGKDYKELFILKSFEQQINTYNELIYFSRPDLLAHYEKTFFEMYVMDKLKELKISNVSKIQSKDIEIIKK